MADLDIYVQSFDIPRYVTVYPDKSGIRWWVKCWLNNSEIGEAAVEIEQQIAIQFLLAQISKEQMLDDYYPKQMEVYRNAIENTKEQLLRSCQSSVVSPQLG